MMRTRARMLIKEGDLQRNELQRPNSLELHSETSLAKKTSLLRQLIYFRHDLCWPLCFSMPNVMRSRWVKWI